MQEGVVRGHLPASGYSSDVSGSGGHSGSALAALALFEPIAVAVHFKDMDVVGEAIEQCAGERLPGGKHAGPLVVTADCW